MSSCQRMSDSFKETVIWALKHIHQGLNICRCRSSKGSRAGRGVPRRWGRRDVIYKLSRAFLTFHLLRECLRMKLLFHHEKIRPHCKQEVLTLRCYMSALCYVFFLHYLTDSSQSNEVSSRKALREAQEIVHNHIDNQQHHQDWECLTSKLRLPGAWLQEHTISIKAKELS